jgi:hypothetical protein
MIVVQDEVANNRRGDEAGEGQDVGDGVDVLVGRELFESIEYRLFGILRRFAREWSVSIW